MVLNFDRSYKKNKRGINLTPLIDIIFLLVVFFMLTSKFVVSNIIELNIAKVEGGQSAKGEAIVITLMPDNKFAIGGISYDIEQLQPRLERLLEKNKGQDIVIASNYKTTVQHIVEAMDSVRAAGGYNVSISGS